MLVHNTLFIQWENDNNQYVQSLLVGYPIHFWFVWPWLLAKYWSPAPDVVPSINCVVLSNRLSDEVTGISVVNLRGRNWSKLCHCGQMWEVPRQCWILATLSQLCLFSWQSHQDLVERFLNVSLSSRIIIFLATSVINLHIDRGVPRHYMGW